MFTIRLRKILLSNFIYYFLLFITIIYLIIYNICYEIDNIYTKDDTFFPLRIKKYKIDGNYLNIEFRENLIGKYYFKNESEKNHFINNFMINDKLSIEGVLEIPSNNTIPNLFNYKEYLRHKNIKYILNIKKYKLINKNNNIFYKIKNIIIKRINSIENNNYLYAFLLGDSSHIDSQTYNNYKTNGITHLFALSGLHVSIFSGIVLSILKKLKVNEKISFVITSFILLFYSFIASFSPSILRAVIFFILSSINSIYYLFIKPKNLLYLTFIILVIINPNYIFNTGFILSFTITFFILLFNENYKITSNINSILIISFISFLSSLPIIININYEINIIGLFNNLVFIPLVSSVIFPLSIMSLIFPFLSSVLYLLTNFMEFMSLLSTKVINITLYFSKISFIEIIIYYILLIFSIKKNIKSRKILFILILYLYFKPFFNNIFIYYLDVGQGDSSLIVYKNKTILIDTGGILKHEDEEWERRNSEYNLMLNSLIPFFKSIGIKKINYLIITHGDYDHMGEAINLVENFKVEKVIFNCGPYNDLEKELIKVLDKKKIKYYSCIKELNIDKNKLYFLQTKEYDNENDNSNVIYTELNGYKFIFMGDASVTTEKEILDKYNLSNIDVLKVGHHGSKTSSSIDFINEINPKYSIISVGKNNRYGHPNKEVLENLKDSKIYRTDQNGSVMFKIKKNKLQVEACSP